MTSMILSAAVVLAISKCEPLVASAPADTNGAVRASLTLSDGVKLRALYHLPPAAKDRKVGTSLVFSPYKIAEKLPDWAKARSDKGGTCRFSFTAAAGETARGRLRSS